MSVSVTLNGSTHSLPTTDETGWGSAVTAFLQAVASHTLQKSGGTFTLTAETDFGATYGVKAAYFKSQTADLAAAGAVRLARADTVSWRNQANGADLALGPGSDNVLEFNSVDLVTVSASQGLTNKTLTAPVVSAVTSSTANAAAAGLLRVARADTLSWRNQANDGDLALGVDASNNLEFNSVDVVTVSGSQALSNKTFAAPTPVALTTPTANWSVDNARYWKDALGYVHVEGTINATGAGGTEIFAAANGLPAGYRPSGSKLGSVLYNDDSGGGFVICGVYASPDGSIDIALNVTPAVDDSFDFSLHFLAEA